MINELKNTELYKKVGGKFKLTALIQKRMLELLEGGRPLVDDAKNMTHLEIVIQEIIEDKIKIAVEEDNKHEDFGL